MELDFSKFYSLLSESGDSAGQFVGKTFADIATTPWFYIPKDNFGPSGKGSGDFKVLVRESGEKWDFFLLSQTSTDASKKLNGGAGVSKGAVDTLKKSFARSDATKTEEGMSMSKLMALSEAYISGNMTLNENDDSGADDKGDTSMVSDKNYSVVRQIVGMDFENVLKLCVGVVTGKPQGGGDAEIMSALKA